MSSLPHTLREDLRTAVVAADYDGLLSLIARIPSQQAELARQLRQRAEEYDYDGLARTPRGE